MKWANEMELETTADFKECFLRLDDLYAQLTRNELSVKATQREIAMVKGAMERFIDKQSRQLNEGM